MSKANFGPSPVAALYKLTKLMEKAGWKVKPSGDAIIICPHDKQFQDCEEPECVVQHVMES